MRRTKFIFGYKLPYGTVHKVSCKKYKWKKFIFLRIENRKAVIFFQGRTERSTFTLYINPKKIIKLK